MEIVFVRHALPLRVEAAADGSPADPALSARGQEQAQRIVEALRHDQISALVTSPSRRARETAAPLAAALGLPLTVEDGVAEFDRNEPSYVPVEELRASNDPRWQALLKGDLYSFGIDPVAFRTRVVEAVERIAEAHPGGRVVVFSHSGTINAWAGHVLSQERPIWFAPDYCSLNRFAAAASGRRGVLSLNDTGHVRDLLHRG